MIHHHLELRERKLRSLANTIFKNVELVMVKHIGDVPFVGITIDVITLKGNVLRVPVVCIAILEAPHFTELTPLYNVADVVSSFPGDSDGGSDCSDAWCSGQNNVIFDFVTLASCASGSIWSGAEGRW